MNWKLVEESNTLMVKSAKKYGVTIKATDRYHPEHDAKTFEVYHNDKLIGEMHTSELFTIISQEAVKCKSLDEIFCALEYGVEKLYKELNKRRSK